MTSILLHVFCRHATKLQILTIDHVPERHRPLNLYGMGQLNWDLARSSFVNYSSPLLFIIYYSRFQELSHFETPVFFFILFVIILKKKFNIFLRSLMRFQRECLKIKFSYCLWHIQVFSFSFLSRNTNISQICVTNEIVFQKWCDFWKWCINF